MKYYSLGGNALGDELLTTQSQWAVDLPHWFNNKYKFYRDEAFDAWNPNSFAFATNDPPLDFFQISDYVHLISPHFQTVLHELKLSEEVGFLPLRLRSSVGDNIIEGYALCNYLKWCKAVDFKRSRLFGSETRFIKHPPHGNYYLDHVALVRSKLGDARLFRVVGCPSLFVYREDVVEALQSAGLSGLEFHEIEV